MKKQCTKLKMFSLKSFAKLMVHNIYWHSICTKDLSQHLFASLLVRKLFLDYTQKILLPCCAWKPCFQAKKICSEPSDQHEQRIQIFWLREIITCGFTYKFGFDLAVASHNNRAHYWWAFSIMWAHLWYLDCGKSPTSVSRICYPWIEIIRLIILQDSVNFSCFLANSTKFLKTKFLAQFDLCLKLETLSQIQNTSCCVSKNQLQATFSVTWKKSKGFNMPGEIGKTRMNHGVSSWALYLHLNCV